MAEIYEFFTAFYKYIIETYYCVIIWWKFNINYYLPVNQKNPVVEEKSNIKSERVNSIDISSNKSKIYADEAHAKGIVQKLWKQCTSEQLYDVILIAGIEGTRIPAHRCVLEAASEYFKATTSEYIKLPNIDGCLLKTLIEYCYTGEIVIRGDNVVQLLETSHMLGLKKVVTACANFLAEHLQPNNCLKFLKIAEEYRCESLLQNAKEFSLEYFDEVSATEDFLELSMEQLSETLGSSNLVVSTEQVVFYSLIKWITHNKIECDKQKADLLRLVRMPLLERSFLIEQVKPVCKSTECLKVYMEALELLALPNGVIPDARKSNELLIAIIKDSDEKWCIAYYCPQQLEWKIFRDSIINNNYFSFGITIMGDELYMLSPLMLKNDNLNMEKLSKRVFCWNLKTLNFKEITPMIKNRVGCSAAVLNGFLYAIGGGSEDEVLNSVEKWNPNLNTWTEVALMSEGKILFNTVTLNNKIYAIGSVSDRIINSPECYDPILNCWNNIAQPSLETYRAAVANGFLYAVDNKKNVERYDPAANKWTVLYENSQCTALDNLVLTNYLGKLIIIYDGNIQEYNNSTNSWENSAVIKKLDKRCCFAFSYSGKHVKSWSNNFTLFENSA